MAAFPSEDRTRQKRAKSEQAISLAMKSRWEEAAQVNRELLEIFPDDVDALNRLGKALMELGRVAEARDAYTRALKIDPANSIATKNLQRLSKVSATGPAGPSGAALDPRLFIGESGKTVLTRLTDVRRSDAVAKLSAGDALRLDVRGKQVIVRDLVGNEIGRIEPKLEHDLLRWLELGNRYSVFVTSATDSTLNVIVRETYRSPEMGNRPSFRPSAAPEGVRSYAREGLLRYELEEEEEEEEEELVEEEEAEADVGAVPPEADVVEETPLETLAAEEEEEAEEPS